MRSRDEIEALEDGQVANDLHVQATYLLTEALVASEKKMRRRVELLSEAVFETDADGRLIFFNKAWTDSLGYECLRNPWRSLPNLRSRGGPAPGRRDRERGSARPCCT